MSEEEKKEAKKTTSRKSTKKDEPKETTSAKKTTSTRKTSTKKDEPLDSVEKDAIGERTLPDPGDHPKAAVEALPGLDLDETVSKPIVMSDLPVEERLSEEEIDAIVKEEQSKVFMMGEDTKKESRKQRLERTLKRTGMITTRDI